MGAVTAPPGPAEPTQVPSLRSSVGADFRDSSWVQRVLLLATGAWLAYEWGLGNETVTPWLLSNVIASTDGARSVVLTAAIGFAFTAAQQLASGFTTAAGFMMFGRTTASAWYRLQARLGEPPRAWAQLPLTVRAALVFTLGTTAVVLIESSLTGAVGVARHRRTIVGSSILCGLIVAAIGALVASLGWLGRSIPALEPTTEWIFRVLSNPLFWIGLVIVAAIGNASRQRWASSRQAVG